MAEEQHEKTSHGIPKDLVPDILVRLPVKSLLRFKCVCEGWASLISSHDFAKENLKHMTESSTISDDGHRIILSYRSDQSMRSINYDPCGNGIMERTSKRLDFPIKQDSEASALEVVGSCNGMLCLFMKDYREGLLSFVFWNPCIPDDFKVVRYMEDDVQFVHNYGFGYDKCSDDYKVVTIDKGHTAIYSLKGKRWYKDKDPLYPPWSEVYWLQISYDAGTYLDGMLYGINSVNPKVLFGFDMKDENFIHVALPESVWGVTQLGVHQGCLLATRRHRYMSGDGPFEEFWKLQPKAVDDKKQLEATRLMTIWSGEGLMSPPRRGFIPLCFGKNGRVLVGCPFDYYSFVDRPQYMFWLYNPEIASFVPQVCELGSYDWSHSCTLMTYVDTLLSPNSF